jgi:hypothetical protein
MNAIEIRIAQIPTSDRRSFHLSILRVIRPAPAIHPGRTKRRAFGPFQTAYA